MAISTTAASGNLYIGGEGKLTLTTEVANGKDLVTVINLGTLNGPIEWAAGTTAELAQGSIIVEGTNDRDDIQADLLARTVLGTGQTLTGGTLLQEGDHAAAQRAFVSGSGKAKVTIGDLTHTLALDELAYPFISGVNLEILPGSHLFSYVIAGTAAGSHQPATYTKEDQDSVTIAGVTAGQGRAFLTNTDDDIADVSLSLNNLSYPFTFDNSVNDIEMAGTSILFGYSVRT